MLTQALDFIGTVMEVCRRVRTKAVYKSLYGEIKSGWEKKGDKYVYTISIPSNCKALIKIKGMDSINVNAGEYKYEI